jgi:hypothetical protein
MYRFAHSSMMFFEEEDGEVARAEQKNVRTEK